MPSITKLILLAATLVISTSALALSNDRDQPADIESDEVDVDFATGKRTFLGNVQFIQGTLRVKADRIDAVFKKGKLATATAYGSPAAFKQRPDGKSDDVQGKANTIVMNQSKNTLVLKEKASLKQGFDEAKGEHIFYNMATDKLKVKGRAKASASNTVAKPSRPKIKDDEFFKKDTSSTTTSAQSAAQTSEIKLPEKLVLPGQSKSTLGSSSNSGRSRLIILPKSK